MGLTRRNFVKLAGMAGLLGLTFGLTACGDKSGDTPTKAGIAQAEKISANEKSKVYFSKNIDAEHLIALYQKINPERLFVPLT